MIFTLGNDVIGHHVKAHGMKVDAEDNAWIMDEAGGVVRKISPDGKVLATIGTPGKRGDWDEAKGQRLLWEPVMIDFGTNGDIFIFMGHHNESPNDADGPNRVEPDRRGARASPRQEHEVPQPVVRQQRRSGEFTGAHGSAVDPQTGRVWIGDREEYRIVIYEPDGTFVKTIQTKNLVCAIYFDRFGGAWVATGLDGQLTKIDRDGNVLGAMGSRGQEAGTWGESELSRHEFEGPDHFRRHDQGPDQRVDAGQVTAYRSEDTEMRTRLSTRRFGPGRRRAQFDVLPLEWPVAGAPPGAGAGPRAGAGRRRARGRGGRGGDPNAQPVPHASTT